MTSQNPSAPNGSNVGSRAGGILMSPLCLSELGCCNTTPQTGRLINNKRSFLTVLEAGSPRSMCGQGLCLLRTRFLVHRQLCPQLEEGARELSGLPNPIMTLIASWGPPPS